MTTQISRRDVIRAAAVSAAALAMPSLTLAQAEKKKIPIGLELYSVRVELPKDFTGVIEKIGKMGYVGVEFAGYHGWDKKPKELKKLLDDNGIRCCGTHVQGGMAGFSGDRLKQEIELHTLLGNKFLICPQVQARGPAQWENVAKQFNEIADKLKEHGMYVGYHSHAPDFTTKYDGKTAWEIVFDNTKPEVVHQIDVGNTMEGGGDPLAMIKKYPGRTKTTHIKEHGGERGAAIGEGTNDWKALFDAYETVGGTEWYIVEYEAGNPMEKIKTCIDNLHKMGK